ncbi:hypothetical protein ACJMK2_007497 [Sinanodonta woodiana]|uniref:Amidohydrolase-related domain-containing protein n=1 Tax=Sinanodonta woodiana TaxID=1069815 RepID=A0ABD3VLP2_SINWO
MPQHTVLLYIVYTQDELLQMLSAGVMGFKCFLIHSGVDDFPAVTRNDLESAFQILQGIPAVVLFHAEVDCGCTDGKSKDAPEKYATFLESRSEEMEIEAIKMVCDLCLMYRVRCHIVHLSAASALPYIINAKSMGAPLTVETCHHYLSFEAESIPNKATQFKCCPPIRQKANQNALWDALKNGHIDMVVSDHSPCTPDLKLLEQGDFLKAWGGIASVQFGLSLFWTNAEDRGFTLADTVRLLCENTAKLANLEHRKGALKIGHDADLVIWDPDASYKVTTDSIHHRNKVTPYLGKELKGVVHMTVVRGRPVFKDGQLLTKPTGSYLFNEKTSPETLKSRFNCSFSYTGPNQEKILAIRRQV